LLYLNKIKASLNLTYNSKIVKKKYGSYIGLYFQGRARYLAPNCFLVYNNHLVKTRLELKN